jgi:hypothetical protein
MPYPGLTSTGAISLGTMTNEFSAGTSTINYRNGYTWLQGNPHYRLQTASTNVNLGYFRGKGLYAYYGVTAGTYTFTTTVYCCLPASWTKPFTATGWCNYGYDPATGVGIDFGSIPQGSLAPVGHPPQGIRGIFRNNSNNEYCVLLSAGTANVYPPNLSMFLWSNLWFLGLGMTSDSTLDPGNGDYSRCWLLSGRSGTFPTQFGISYGT